MKVILNKSYGGFSVSQKGYIAYAKKAGIDLYCYERTDSKTYTRVDDPKTGHSALYSWFTKNHGKTVSSEKLDWSDCFYLNSDKREDPILISVVEELGDEVNTIYSNLKVVDIPDDMDYVIDDYDGVETLHERVREW